jgi:hypothetical protein
LVVAVNGNPERPFQSNTSILQAAVIDEERWLLETIDSRGFDESRAVKACPPTFLQAMGERDYENPLTSLSNGSRTQLWKPSRSWWEAKSGKNPWIEPISHNKRWRYVERSIGVCCAHDVYLRLTFPPNSIQIPVASYPLPQVSCQVYKETQAKWCRRQDIGVSSFCFFARGRLRYL